MADAKVLILSESVPFTDFLSLELPAGAEVLSVAPDPAGTTLVFHYLVRDIEGDNLTPMGHPPSLPIGERPLEDRQFRVLAERNPVAEAFLADCTYFDTVVIGGQSYFVFAESAPEPEAGPRSRE